MKEIIARDRYDYTGSFTPDYDEDMDPDDYETGQHVLSGIAAGRTQMEMKGLAGKTVLPDGIYLWCSECEKLHSAEENYEKHLWKWIPISMDGGSIRL